ncbi:MAG: ribonuclease H-like domain-containing protein [Planctomycetota bacterium]
MSSESRKRKLEKLTRSIAQGRFGAARDILASTDRPGPARPVQAPSPMPLTQACPGRECEVIAPAGAMPCWLIEQTLHQFSPADRAITGEYERVLRGARQRYDELEASVELCHLTDVGPDELLFMDTETCGFAGSPIFLLGMMFYEGGELVFQQYLARDYTEEEPVLRAYANRVERHRMLVTFNGKSFDVPRIAERSAFFGIEPPWQEPVHLDLLHECRRHYKRALPNCKLQTLERYLCGRHRVGDIPGAAIPDAYHRFVDTQDARQLQDILHHNALDLLTMAQLVCCVLTGAGPVID